MNTMERITWIGPMRAQSSAGEVARSFVRGLTSIGIDVSALDTHGPSTPPLDASDACEDRLVGPVRPAGSTVVVQATLSDLAQTARYFACQGASKRVAYIVVDATEIDAETRAVIDECDEVWTPSTLQRELAASLGVARAQLRVIPAGIDVALSRGPVHAPAARTRVVVDGDMAFVATLRSIATEFDVVLAPRHARAAERARVFHSCDLALALRTGDAWWRFGAEALAAGTALAHVEDGLAAEFVDASNAIVLEESVVRDPKVLARTLSAILADGSVLERSARAARTTMVTEFTLESAARRLIRRTCEPWCLPEERLTRVLADLGLPTPREIIGASKSRILVCAVRDVVGAWHEELAQFLATHSAADDVTFVVWVDEALAPRVSEVAAIADGLIMRCARGLEGADVALVVASVDHAPSAQNQPAQKQTAQNQAAQNPPDQRPMRTNDDLSAVA